MELRVLSALDKARTQWYHFSAIIVSGLGFFTGAYNLFCIPPIYNLLGRLYYDESLPLSVGSLINGVALCGAFVGHLVFGWLGDRMGRRKVYGQTLIIMFASSFASGFSIGRSRNSVIISLCFFRFWLGFGIGGDYPLSAIIMAEYANTTTRGAFMASVYAMQSLGILAASSVAAIVSAIFIRTYPNPTFEEKDILWRVILMLGAVPALFSFYLRMKVPETARYTALVARNTKQAAADMAKVLKLSIAENEDDVRRIQMTSSPFGLFSRDFAKLHGLKLLGTASTWFFIDLVFYSNNLFQNNIYKAVGWLRETYKTPLHEVFHMARAQACIALMATLPGCILAVFLIDRLGRFRIQMGGFLLMAVSIFAMAIPYETYWLKPSHKKGFVAVYSLTFFFSNFGPNTTTFIVPAELFPARLRSTCHGISGAAGKAGAMVGAFGFIYAAQPRHKNDPHLEKGYHTGIGIRNTLIVVGVASLMGCLFTFLIPETNGMSLEENEVELPKSGPLCCDTGSGSGSDSSEDSTAR